MTSNTRLRICVLIIILSAMYAVTVAKDPQLAAAIASGYVAVVLTGIVLTNIWKRP